MHMSDLEIEIMIDNLVDEMIARNAQNCGCTIHCL